MGLARAEFERVLVMVTFRFCSAVQPIPVSEVTPWGTMSQYKRGRPDGPTVLPSGTQVAYQRNRLARWAEKRSAWAYGAPGRCPDGLGEPRTFGPGTYRVSRKKTGTLPTHSDPRSRVDLRRPVRPYTLRWAGKSLRDLVSLLHTFDGLAQCAKLPSEIGQLVMGVQAAGVRQHPDDRALQRLRLAAEFCEPV